MTALYTDPLITITDDGIRIGAYSLFLREKVVPWADVESVRALQPTLWNGRWRLWGTANFNTWLPWDLERPRRETIFVAHLRSQSIRVGFTAHDSRRVKQVLAERGVLVDEQGDALPAPAPVESRPVWRWGAFYALLALLIVLVAQSVCFHPQLPQRVASRFDFSGVPTAWASRAVLSGVLTATGCFVGAIFLLIGLGMSRSAMAFIGRYLLWIGTATLALLLFIAHMTFRANLSPSPSLSPAALYALLVYLAVLAGLAAMMLRQMIRPQR